MKLLGRIVGGAFVAFAVRLLASAAMPDANTALQRWKSGTQAAGPKYTQGVQSGKSWTAGYIAAEPQMAQAIQAALAAGRFTAGVNALGDASYKNITVAKAGNWLTGVNTQQAANNYLAGYNVVQQVVGAGLNAIASMPTGSYADNRARALAYMDASHQQAQTLKGF